MKSKWRTSQEKFFKGSTVLLITSDNALMLGDILDVKSAKDGKLVVMRLRELEPAQDEDQNSTASKMLKEASNG